MLKVTGQLPNKTLFFVQLSVKIRLHYKPGVLIELGLPVQTFRFFSNRHRTVIRHQSFSESVHLKQERVSFLAEGSGHALEADGCKIRVFGICAYFCSD